MKTVVRQGKTLYKVSEICHQKRGCLISHHFYALKTRHYYLTVMVEGRRPKCYECGVRCYMKTQYFKQKPFRMRRQWGTENKRSIPQVTVADSDSKNDMKCSINTDEAETKRMKATSKGSDGFVSPKMKKVKAGENH